MRTELSMSAEDLTSGRAQIIDDDEDDHDDHDDSDKINDAEGMDPERLKAFNVSQKYLILSRYSMICISIKSLDKQVFNITRCLCPLKTNIWCIEGKHE